MSSIITPFQLLELNVISAQDLVNVSRNMRTYAVAWVHPDRKLTTRVDNSGRTNPTWNDKFVFRVNEDFLVADTSAVMIEIYALHWFRDVHVGTVRVLVGNLIPPPPKPHQKNPPQLGMRFAALQVRRPSGRPQGILNVGVALLDSSMRSMPLYTQLDQSAVGYRTFMGETEVHSSHQTSNIQFQHQFINPNQQFHHSSTYGKSELRRTRSDSSSMIESTTTTKQRKPKRASSVVNGGSDVSKNKGSSKGSSVISGSDVVKKREKKVKSGSIVNGSFVGGNTKKKGMNDGSMVTDSEPPKKENQITTESVKAVNNNKEQKTTTKEKQTPPLAPPQKNISNEVVKNSPMRFNNNINETGIMNSPMRSKVRSNITKYSGMEHGTSQSRPASRLYGGSQYGGTSRTYNFATRPVITESELGPSASEVAAKIANTYHHNNDDESSIAGEWSLDGSVEGLRSKLARWRTELPPVYDNSEYNSSYPSSHAVKSSAKGKSNVSKHKRRHTEGDGLFSCFSNICGVECSIVCGGSGPRPPGSAPRNKNGNSGRLIRTPKRDDHDDDISYL